MRLLLIVLIEVGGCLFVAEVQTGGLESVARGDIFGWLVRAANIVSWGYVDCFMVWERRFTQSYTTNQ